MSKSGEISHTLSPEGEGGYDRAPAERNHHFCRQFGRTGGLGTDPIADADGAGYRGTERDYVRDPNKEAYSIIAMIMLGSDRRIMGPAL